MCYLYLHRYASVSIEIIHIFRTDDPYMNGGELSREAISNSYILSGLNRIPGAIKGLGW